MPKITPFRPYEILNLEVPTSTRRRKVQAISRPYEDMFTDADGYGQRECIQVRMVPGDPTTMVTVPTSRLERVGFRYNYIHFAEVWGRPVVELIGTLEFPEDMLRYEAAALYDHTINEEDYRPTGPVRIYMLTENTRPIWTAARWLSFGWGIRHCLTERLGTK
jgi:hypothetical protein